ncbi:MAG: substrate-binding domain-containing protein, partial [Acidimicrobiales bacterium]
MRRERGTRPVRDVGRRMGIAALALAGMLGVVAGAFAPDAAASPSLESTGSSFAGVAIQQWVGQAATLYGLNINWQVSSSVIGLDDYAQNEIDFGASDIPYSSGQATSTPTTPYQYMPDVAGALAFMYNLTGVNGQRITNLVLDAHVIDEIFSGAITKWNDQQIVELQPTSMQGDLPDTTILGVYRVDASGENYLLSQYMLQMDGSFFRSYQQAVGITGQFLGAPSANWPAPSQQGWSNPNYPGWPSDMVGQSGSDNAADYVSAASSDGAITYVETAYAKEHALPVASVINQAGNAVQPTSVNDATALEKAILYSDLTQNLSGVFSNDLPNAYPISAYSYLVTPCSPALAAAQHPASHCSGPSGTSTFPAPKGQALGQFISFLACAGQQQMALLGYSPLPPNLVQEDFDAIGRLNGGQEPPPVSPADCKNPYVDGQTPLPGEPTIVGQAHGTPGSGPGTGSGGSGGTGKTGGGPSGVNGGSGSGGTVGGGSTAGGGGNGGGGTTGSGSGTSGGGASAKSGSGKGGGGPSSASGASKYLLKLKKSSGGSGPNSFARAADLEAAA